MGLGRGFEIKTKALAALAVAGLLLGACTTPADLDDPDAVAEWERVNDPVEDLNRGIFTVNQVFDRMLLKPMAVLYKDLLPPPMQSGINNFLNNLRTPIILANDLLQGEVGRAGDTTMRFLINSTYGVGGLVDQAHDMGFEYHNEDFGQTLAVWGFGEGPYLMLPVLGPSNPRDTVGMVVDFFVDPLNWWAGNQGHDWIVYGRASLRAVDSRARYFDTLEDLERSSLDYYAAIRSLHRQRRADEINNGASPDDMPTPSISDEPDLPSIDDEEASRKR